MVFSRRARLDRRGPPPGGVALNLLGTLRPSGRPGILLNRLGASLACHASYLIAFTPFPVLERARAAAAAVALMRAAGLGSGRI